VILSPIKNVIIAAPDAELEFINGIYLPPSAREAMDHGRVVATGPNVKQVFVGDEVYYNRHSVTLLEIDRQPYVAFKEPEAIALLV
jgi:co-chaperonin GroES (HSP10)